MLAWPLWTSSSSRVTSFGVIVIVGPGAPTESGWSVKTTCAVINLVTLAMGSATSGPDWAVTPRAGIAIADWPPAGHERAGALPATNRDDGRVERTNAWGGWAPSRWATTIADAPNKATITARTARMT